MWIVNRRWPSLWCRVFHREWHFRSDWGMWYAEDRASYEVQCLSCGRCWSVKVEGRKEDKEKIVSTGK